MNKNINVDLFRRFSASNKVEMVNALTKDKLLSVTEQTITRIVKEVGSNYSKSRDKKISKAKSMSMSISRTEIPIPIRANSCQCSLKEVTLIPRHISPIDTEMIFRPM